MLRVFRDYEAAHPSSHIIATNRDERTRSGCLKYSAALKLLTAPVL